MARTIAWHNRDSFWKTIVSFSRSNSSTNCRKTFWLNRWPRTKPECDHMVYGMSLVYERGLLSKQHFNNTLKLTNDFFSLRVKWNFSKIRIYFGLIFFFCIYYRIEVAWIPHYWKLVIEVISYILIGKENYYTIVITNIF